MRNRSAFTLLEMMVVIALTLFIMVVLSQAFSAGLDVFRDLKAYGDMEQELRGASNLLRRDLSADHFEGKRRLSDPNIWSLPAREGFFRVYQAASSVDEFGALNTTQPGCWRAVGVHALHLSVKLRGNTRDSVFYTTVPAGSTLLAAQTTFFNEAIDARFQDQATTFATPWAEVAYVLVQTGTTTAPNDPTVATGTPLFALYRVQFLVTTDSTRVNATNPIPSARRSLYPGVSFRVAGKNLVFNNPGDLVTQANRRLNPATRNVTGFGALTQANAGSFGGATLVLSNVISFDVRVLKSTSLGSTVCAPVAKTDFEDFSFDSSQMATTTAYVIKGLEVCLRIWDQKTGLTQQASVVQDL